MPSPPTPTPIFHITHVDNLPTILSLGGLISCAMMNVQATSCRSIAHESIQDKRARTVVPCGLRGTLHDYIPFYFAPRSPMLYTISRGNVANGTGGQQRVVHLVSTAQAVYTPTCPVVFTDGHAIMALSQFFDNLADLDKIDWPLMSAEYWNDTQEDPDRKRRRQAEYLIHQQMSWNLISEIGVFDRHIKAEVQTILKNSVHQPPVTVWRRWYY